MVISSKFQVPYLYLPIIVDESRFERIYVQDNGQSTASYTNVIHAGDREPERAEREKKDIINQLIISEEIKSPACPSARNF